MELQDLYGLTFPMWCVRGGFNVIRRISEKLGASRLTPNMRRFDEFMRILNWLVVNSPRTMEQRIIPDLHRGIDGDSQISQNRM